MKSLLIYFFVGGRVTCALNTHIKPDSASCVQKNNKQFGCWQVHVFRELLIKTIEPERKLRLETYWFKHQKINKGLNIKKSTKV